ncbi:MAG TPA: DUF4407 domain-containing protein [Thermoanaerobaculia bacterium]|nr:DUF4407 domain-containing protein [Thermoanaerobaculia bacterium]
MIARETDDGAAYDGLAEVPPELHLHLRVPPPTEPRPQPGWLARGLGLHLYSEALLGKRARIEMNFAAVVLLIVTLFELLAWSFLFNAIFNSDIYYLGWGTVPAVLVAMLFAAAVFWFERQFLVHDEVRKLQAMRAARVRVAFIVAAALVTAQPLELFFFRRPVERRVHEEGIREEAVRRLNARAADQERTADHFAALAARRQEAVKVAQSGMDEEARRRSDLERELREEEGSLAGSRAQASAAEQELSEARRREADDPDAVRAAQASYRRAVAAAAAAAAQVERTRFAITQSRNASSDLERRWGDAQKQADTVEANKQTQEEQADERLRDWFHHLQDAEPGPITESAARAPVGKGKPWHYGEPDYDFFAQVQVVWDLVRGLPPRWSNGADATRRMLEDKYGFRSDSDRRGLQWHLLLAVVACHLIALYIPLLVLTIKLFLMPQELRSYYSSLAQARAGEPDALLAWSVEQGEDADSSDGGRG